MLLVRRNSKTIFPCSPSAMRPCVLLSRMASRALWIRFITTCSNSFRNPCIVFSGQETISSTRVKVLSWTRHVSWKLICLFPIAPRAAIIHLPPLASRRSRSVLYPVGRSCENRRWSGTCAESGPWISDRVLQVRLVQFAVGVGIVDVLNDQSQGVQGLAPLVSNRPEHLPHGSELLDCCTKRLLAYGAKRDLFSTRSSRCCLDLQVAVFFRGAPAPPACDQYSHASSPAHK